jgi:hypothetical protein
MHKIEENQQQNDNVFVEGLNGWKSIISKVSEIRKKPEAEQQQPQKPPKKEGWSI